MEGLTASKWRLDVPTSDQIQLHEDIGAVIGRRRDLSGVEVSEAERLVEPDGGREGVVGFEVEPAGVQAARFVDGGLQDAAANSLPLVLGRNGHLSDFELAGADAEERAAADGLAVDDREKNLTAGGEDGFLRVGEGGLVLVFNAEVGGDPLLVEGSEGGLVAGLEEADENLLGALNRTRHCRLPSLTGRGLSRLYFQYSFAKFDSIRGRNLGCGREAGLEGFLAHGGVDC